MLKKIVNFIKENKKKVILILLILVLLIISISTYNFFRIKKDIYIEVASNNINYIYGPNNSTLVKMKVGEKLKINILTDTKKSLIKCQSNNENIVKFNEKNTIKALNKGETFITCRFNNNISNSINIKVGD